MFSRKMLIAIFALHGSAECVELVVQNDSLLSGGQSTIQSGFAAGERAAVWLDSPCDGSIVAAQVLWLSQSGGTPPSLENAILIHEAGIFPEPGALLESIIGPFLTDGAINEFRFLDKNNSVPINVPVLNGQTFVLSFIFSNSPSVNTASLVTDLDGCQTGRNSIFAIPPNQWFSSCLLGVSGDFVIRAVIDCPLSAGNADLVLNQSADPALYRPGEALNYTITLANEGPDMVNGALLTDNFPNQLENIQWNCQANNGASCGIPTSGSGNISRLIDLPVSSNVVLSVNATVNAATTGLLSNTVEVMTPTGVTDPILKNNISTLVLNPFVELVFQNGFETL